MSGKGGVGGGFGCKGGVGGGDGGGRDCEVGSLGGGGDVLKDKGGVVR